MWDYVMSWKLILNVSMTSILVFHAYLWSIDIYGWKEWNRDGYLLMCGGVVLSLRPWRMMRKVNGKLTVWGKYVVECEEYRIKISYGGSLATHWFFGFDGITTRYVLVSWTSPWPGTKFYDNETGIRWLWWWNGCNGKWTTPTRDIHVGKISQIETSTTVLDVSIREIFPTWISRALQNIDFCCWIAASQQYTINNSLSVYRSRHPPRCWMSRSAKIEQLLLIFRIENDIF